MAATPRSASCATRLASGFTSSVFWTPRPAERRRRTDMHKRFVKIGTMSINPDLVEGLSLANSGGRETVWIHMISGKKNPAPANLSMDDVIKKLEGTDG